VLCLRLFHLPFQEFFEGEGGSLAAKPAQSHDSVGENIGSLHQPQCPPSPYWPAGMIWSVWQPRLWPHRRQKSSALEAGSLTRHLHPQR